MRARNRKVYGFGINDADYMVRVIATGKDIICPFYQCWMNMIKRCYSKPFKDKYKTYADCVVCDDWVFFSNFKSWMELQDWRGKELDKDLICVGNKVYSPDTCAFVERRTNTFVEDSAATRGKFLIGVSFDAGRNLFYARCKDPFEKRTAFLGFFKTETDAHMAWKTKKHQLACMLADLQTDKRVADALRTRYL